MNYRLSYGLAQSFSALIVIVLVLFAAQNTRAAGLTFTINEGSDGPSAVDVNPGDGECLNALGFCTLRAAVMEANSHVGADTISLPSLSTCCINLNTPGTGEDAAVTGDLDITDDVSIIGNRLNGVDGNDLDRVFEIHSATVIISGLIIRDGHSFRGGGISMDSGTLTLTDSTIMDNSSADPGSGIYARGSVTISNSLIFRNRDDYGLDVAGATIIDSTIKNNWEGGMVNYGWATATTITNSTISGNIVRGGITNRGLLTITNSTISDNSGGGLVGYGSATIANSIVANQASGSDCAGTVSSEGHNIDSDSTCNLAAAGDKPGIDPLLGPLTLNAPGNTETHAILSGSPAIDAANNATCPASDQRGVARPQSWACDIGAYESSFSAPTPTDTPTPSPTPSPTLSPTPSPTLTVTPTPTVTATPTPTPKASPTQPVSPSPTVLFTPTTTSVGQTPSPTPTLSPTPTATLVGQTPSTTTIPAPSPTATPTPAPPSPLPDGLGDVNCDGLIDGSDVVLVLADVGGIGAPSDCLDKGDIDEDGHITTKDALLILKFWAGFPTALPATS